MLINQVLCWDHPVSPDVMMWVVVVVNVGLLRALRFGVTNATVV